MVKWEYMKKLLLSILSVCILSAAAQARTVDVTAAYTGASHFTKADAGATVALSLNTLAGIQARYVNDDVFKDPIYSVYLPIHMDFDYLKFNFTPFYYFKNKSDDARYQDASAFGLNSRLIITMQDDEVNDLYTHAFIGASFARQKGTLTLEGADPNQYYSEAAYTLGLHKDFYRAFGFELIGTVFQYPDGITGVESSRGIMDQQDLASTQTLDIVRELPKYAVGTRLTRMWADDGSSIYLSYRFGEYHTTDSQHSFVVGNSFIVGNLVSADMAYNHVRSVHNKDKRDIFYIRLGMSF